MGFRRDVGAALQQRLHHRRVPGTGGIVQAGFPDLVFRLNIRAGQPIAYQSVYMVYLCSRRIHIWDIWRSTFY